MLEAPIERGTAKYAKERGVLPIKLDGMHNRGKPDHIFFYQGRVLVVEFKATGKKMTAIQAEWKKKFEKHSFSHLVIDSLGEGKNAIDALINDELDIL